MYVDESGDAGVPGASPTFVLTGMVLHELRWHDTLAELVDFRRWCRAQYGLKLREEIHAARWISRPNNSDILRIPRHQRLAIIHAYARRLAQIPALNIINVVVNKANKAQGYDVFTAAWRALIQRFENTINHRNFAGPVNPDDRGLLIPDHSDDKKIQTLLRQMRHYNPVPNQPQYGQGYRNLALARLAEDPNFRDSRHSYFVQSCDLAAFLLYQRERPNAYVRNKGARNYFRLLDPILCKVAATHDSEGVVRL
jgi:hypothetical protein